MDISGRGPKVEPNAAPSVSAPHQPPHSALPSPDSDLPSRFDAVVFAGGGCRCFWQVGFWQTAAPALGLRPRAVAAVSAGAAMACMVFADAVADGLADFKRRAATNRRNIYPLNPLARRPMFPQAAIYRETILATLSPARLAELQRGPDVRVLIARVPPWLGPRSGFLVAVLAYEAEKLLRRRGPHDALGRRVGFRPEVATVRDCRSPDELADLILHSSCTPPFTPAFRRNGQPVIDGGLIDSVPVDVLPAPSPSTLVLLSRQYAPDAIPAVAGRTYIQPSAPIPVQKWDYTNPAGVQATYDLGRRDGERFAAQWRDGA